MVWRSQVMMAREGGEGRSDFALFLFGLRFVIKEVTDQIRHNRT